MKPLLYIAVALLFMSFFACSPDKPGTGLYFYTPVADGTEHADTTLSFVSFLELRQDGSYSQDFGHFDYGSWALKADRLYLTNQRRRTYIYHVLSLTKAELDLRMDSGITGHFRPHLMPSGSPEKDPFSAYNNQWRIPATHKESDADIRKRLFNHCQFWESFFKWVNDRNESVVDVAYFPSPLKVYSNGFGLKHYDNLPPVWKSYFFDEEDCHKADTLIKHTFRRNKINWPHTKDDFEKLISGFQQLQQFLR
ncbi:hypothetical protein [Puia sp.]|jgi:hypothetical protein|uniref:hypothetical protein n=1 Tax=Puia sp. TaxID=2045100 RepID=UPI002F3F7C4C